MKAGIFAGVVLVAWPAWAEQVYRCGNVYQQAPCTGGRAVEVSDGRSDEDRRAAAAVARGDKKLGADLERERRARDAGIRPAPAVGIGARVVEREQKPVVRKRKLRKAEGEVEVEVWRAPGSPARPAPRKGEGAR